MHLNTANRDDFADEWSVPGSGPHVLILDHHDSFTYNLVQSLSSSGARITVRQAYRHTLADVEKLSPERIVLSPGPGKPQSAALAMQVMKHYRGRMPILGVCLGHQVLALSVGAKVVASGTPVHGKADQISHCGSGIFRGLPNPLSVARYHSLHVIPETLPADVAIVAWSESGGIMGLAIPGESTWGVQFHPESFLTPEGDLLLKAFVDGIPCPRDLPQLKTLPHAKTMRSGESQELESQGLGSLVKEGEGL
ncbi:MAG: hypothetical protein CBC13_10915 [Planctomycetia bacterium TMED53]|nr:MAG: hypothetical protein CBC13_10915 [Planctomycetia bacterium TMED53]